MRRALADVLGFLATLVILPILARADAKHCTDPAIVNQMLAQMNAAPALLVESEAARRSLNEFRRHHTDADDEHQVIYAGTDGEGAGLLVFGSPGSPRCAVLQVPAPIWPTVLRIILGTPV
jgi:hypothetical protein